MRDESIHPSSLPSGTASGDRLDMAGQEGESITRAEDDVHHAGLRLANRLDTAPHEAPAKTDTVSIGLVTSEATCLLHGGMRELGRKPLSHLRAGANHP